MTKMEGKWELLQIVYFDDEERALTAAELGLESAHLSFAPDGAYSGEYWGVSERGRWSAEGDTLTLHNATLGETITLTLEDGRLLRPDHDEEHGWDMEVEYARAGAKTPRTKNAVKRFLRGIYDEDHYDLEALRRLLNDGDALALGLLDEAMALCMAIGAEEVEVAELLIERGADLTQIDEAYLSSDDDISMLAVARDNISDPEALARIEAALGRRGAS